MSKLVSIIVPVYNIENYAENCIKSLINQTHNFLEIILVDDGSTDNSGKICDNFAQKDKRIKVIHKTNGGLSSARNAGIDIATGDYFMFVDGDDYIAENAVEILLECMATHDADMVQFDYEETSVPYQSIKSTATDSTEIVTDLKQMFEKLYLIGGPAASSCTKLYKKELFKTLRFKEGIIHEDEFLITELLQKVKSIVYIPDKLYFYVMRTGSIVKSGFSKKRLDALMVSENRIDKLEDLGFSELKEKEKCRWFTTAVNLWCDTTAVKDYKNRKIIHDKIYMFIKNNNLKISGKFRLLYHLCKFNINLLYVYYLFKKFRKQV